MSHNNPRLRALIFLFSASLLPLANILIFNTFQIFRKNSAEFEVGLSNMVGPLSLWAGTVIFITILPGFILPVALVRKYASFLLMLGILTWFQASILLWDYGVFDGRSTNWGEFDLYGWLDISLWIGLLIVSVRYTKRVLPALTLAALILFIGQTALLLIQAGLERNSWNKNLSSTGEIPSAMFEVSQQKNIVHIILDSMQTDVFLELAEKQGLSDEFAGFTLFYENTGVTPHTSFAIPAIFSGEIYDGSESPSSYYKNSMTNGFQNELYRAGFTVNLIPQLSMRDSNYSNYYKIPGSYKGTVEDLKQQNAAQLLDIALFRGVPHFLRKALYNEGEWFLLARVLVGRDMPVRSFQEKIFFSDYTKNLKLGGDTPAYHFVHMVSPHPPYVTLANGSYAGKTLPNTRENYLNESQAIIELVVQYIKKLKSLGVYDDSMIILQGDHGSQITPVVNGKQIQTCAPRIPALLVIKPSHSDGPLKTSHAPTSLLDVAPTILSALGHDGQSVFDLDESLARQRLFMLYNGDGVASKITNYSINGSIFDPESCKFVESREIKIEADLYELGAEIQFGMTGNADSFMGAGWSACQPDYCWATGNQTDLTLPIDEVTTDLQLQVRFKPYLNELKLPEQRISVFVNGTQLAEWLVSRYVIQDASVRIPAELVHGEYLQIQFNFPDAVSPNSLGVGADMRILGMRVHSLRIDMLSNE